jgi:hypothetical protein
MADLQVLASEAFGVQSSAGETCEAENVLEHTGKDSILKKILDLNSLDYNVKKRKVQF